MKENGIIDKTIAVLKETAIILLLFIAINVLVTSVLFICHVSISMVNIIVSTILTIIVTIIRNKDRNKISLCISGVLSVIIILVTLFIASHTYDTTWDGNTYHKLAVGMLTDGWNPVYETAIEYIEKDSEKLGLMDDERNSIWIEHYPKASWIFSANLYSVTGSIETSKIITMLMMYIAFAIILSYLNKKINIIFAVLVGALIAINPITMVQAFSYYIDGLMGLCIYIILCTLLDMTKIGKFEPNKELDNWIILAATLLVCINLKFTGLVYAGIFCFMFFVIWLIDAYKDGTIKENATKYVIYYVVVVLVSLCVVGFSSYVKNTINKGFPLYPLMGKNKVDIMTYNEPKSFPERGAIDKFFTSMFAVSENVKSNSTDKDPTLKIPFTIKKGEIGQFAKPDTRMAGFGVLFSGIFIITVISLGYLMFEMYKNKQIKEFWILTAFVLVTILLILITDGSWWARYVPYVYLYPLIAVVLFASKKGLLNKVAAGIICSILIINVAIISYASCSHTLSEYRKTEKAFAKMELVNKSGNEAKISLRTGACVSLLYNVRDKGIDVKIVDQEELENKKYTNYFYYENKK